MSADRNNIYKNYNPDILETIANLSNDEVFTPPKLANEILDLLPEEVWSNPNLTFLDPAVKTGIFLREIASRLIDGLADQIPDLQERVNHILTKQVFGIGITELTTLMARRTVYCSTTANGPYSICTEFDDEKGNIIFPNTEHTWDKNGRCEYCGANSDNYGGGTNRENYAYPFIHDNFEKEFGNMKFDVIIGNPPYQLSFGNEGRNSAGASSIYHLFVDKAFELNPKYITMIMPSRWMTKNARGIPDGWTDKIIKDRRMKQINDFQNAREVFPTVDIKGGVSYFLWDSSHNGKCKFIQNINNDEKIEAEYYLDEDDLGVIIRDINARSILKKILKNESNYHKKEDKNFSSMVSPGSFFDYKDRFKTNWEGFSKEKTDEYSLEYHTNSFVSKTRKGWVKPEDVIRNKEVIGMNKVYINSVGNGEKFGPVLAKPFYGAPNSICSETYLVIGYDYKKHNFSKEECLNIISYIKTKFFRFMVDIKKSTQHCRRGVYQFVPLQDFSKPWTDEELYKKYKLTQEEIDYIENNIDPMD